MRCKAFRRRLADAIECPLVEAVAGSDRLAHLEQVVDAPHDDGVHAKGHRTIDAGVPAQLHTKITEILQNVTYFVLHVYS